MSAGKEVVKRGQLSSFWSHHEAFVSTIEIVGQDQAGQYRSSLLCWWITTIIGSVYTLEIQLGTMVNVQVNL